MGYQGLVIDERGGAVYGIDFTFLNLSAKWAVLDELEGDDYEHTVVSATLESGEQVQAHVPVLRTQTAPILAANARDDSQPPTAAPQRPAASGQSFHEILQTITAI